MVIINYPPPAFRMKKEGGKEWIFDGLRKKWLMLTPEEWVRQNFVNYLVSQLHYPSSLIALEKEIFLGEMKKRFDVLVYDRDHQPWMMIECKAPSVKLEQEVLSQLLRYHISVPVAFLVITNGEGTYAWAKEEGSLLEIDALPDIQK